MARLTHEEFVRRMREPMLPPKEKIPDADTDDIQRLLEKKFEELFGSMNDEDDD